MSFFGWGKGGANNNTTTDHSGRNLQDGLFQIASQACHILVQVNNTHNVSYGGSNRVTNVAYSKYSGAEGSSTLSPGGASASYSKNADARLKDQDVVVLLPQRKSRTPRIRHKLANEPKKSEKIIKTKIHSLLENQILQDMKSQMTVQVREPQPGPSTLRDYQEDCSLNTNQSENKSVESDWLMSEVNSLIDDTDLCAVSIISLHQDLKKISERLSYLKDISMSAINMNNKEKKCSKDKTMDDGKNDLPLIEPQKQTEFRRRSYNMPLFDNRESDEEKPERIIDDEPLSFSPSKSPISVGSSPSLITSKKRKTIILDSESEDDSDLEFKKQKKVKFIKKCENEREKEAHLEGSIRIKKEHDKNYEQQIILQQEEDEDNKEDATWTLKYTNANSANHTVSENARLDVNSPTYDDDFDFWDQTGFMLRNDVDDPLNHGRWGAQEWCRPSCIPITFILVLIVLVVLLPLLDHAPDKQNLNGTGFGNESEMACMSDCDISLVESIPVNLTYPNGSVIHRSTFTTWLDLIAAAQNTVEIASLYWTMNREDVYPDDSAREGEIVFQALVEAGRDRGITLKIAQNSPSQLSPDIDTEHLAKKANAQVRSLNFAALLGGGVLHTKLWLIDRTHVYVGSANMDWRSLTQVKELGLVAFNCSCMANDLAKIFDVYWTLGETGKIPATWPKSLATKINMENPMTFTLNGNKYRSFIGSSPPKFSPEGRTNDIDGLIHCIEKAEKFIYVAVMDYYPLMIYGPKIKYWPVIDNALKTAAVERKVNVRLLISKWKHTGRSEDYFLRALEDLTNSYNKVKIEVRRFIVPTNPELDKIPFGRVNHNKYMVTDTAAYIGTSNWSGDYFVDTAGIGMIFEDADRRNENSLRQQLQELFERDWNSPYAQPLNASCGLRAPPKGLLGRSQLVPPPLNVHHVPLY